MVGVLNEYVRLAGNAHDDLGSTPNLVWLSDWLAQTPMGPLDRRHGSADHELAALTASASGSGGTGPFKGGLMPSSSPG